MPISAETFHFCVMTNTERFSTIYPVGVLHLYYKDYQNLRDASWKILLDCGINRLPVDIDMICRRLGVRVLSYDVGAELIERGHLSGQRVKGIHRKKPCQVVTHLTGQREIEADKSIPSVDYIKSADRNQGGPAMPKLKQSAKVRMYRAFMAALRYGQELRGEKDADTARLMPRSTATYYKHIKNLDMFTREELRVLIPRYFTDRQLCDAFGVEYHGFTTN